MRHDILENKTLTDTLELVTDLIETRLGEELDIELVEVYQTAVKGRYWFKFECDEVIKEMPLIVSELTGFSERQLENILKVHLDYLVKRFRENLP